MFWSKITNTLSTSWTQVLKSRFRPGRDGIFFSGSSCSNPFGKFLPVITLLPNWRLFGSSGFPNSSLKRFVYKAFELFELQPLNQQAWVEIRKCCPPNPLVRDLGMFRNQLETYCLDLRALP